MKRNEIRVGVLRIEGTNMDTVKRSAYEKA